MSVVLNDPRVFAETVAILRAVLDGESYEVVGWRYGVGRSAVERRIKVLVEHLIHTVGIAGLSLDCVAFVRRLRMHRDEIEQALEQTLRLGVTVETPVLNRERLQQAADRLGASSAHVAHDLALFYLLFTTGMRPLELARLTVRDCVTAAGQICSVSELRAEVSHNGKVRPFYLNSPRLIRALVEYVQERCRRRHGLGENSDYLGLCPDSPLFLNSYGVAYVLRRTELNGRVRHRCRGMQEALRQVFRHAGLPALSSRDARRTVAGLLYDQGADESQVGLLLGIRDNSAVRALLFRPRPSLADLMQRLL